jgi:deoxycytidylate deaminase
MSIRIASKEALKSQHKQHKLGAVIEKGGRILSVGYNSIRPSHVLKTNTLHAEAAAILKLLKDRRQHDLVGSNLYVSRFTRGGRIGMARPCPHCRSLAQSVGIRQVFYTTDEGTTETMKL